MGDYLFLVGVIAPHPVCNIEIIVFAVVVKYDDGFSASIDIPHRLVTAPNMASA